MARPTKLKPDVIERLVEAIELGSSYELACNYAGITYQTFRNWMRKAETAKRGTYRDFGDRIRVAEGVAVTKWLRRINEAADNGQWQPAAWLLERRYPQDYGRRDRVSFKLEDQSYQKLAAELGVPVDVVIAEAVKVHEEIKQ